MALLPGNDELRAQLHTLSVRDRLFLLLYLVPAALGTAAAGYCLLDFGETWIARSVALFIIEPIALACILAVVVLVAPDSGFADVLVGAVRRASYVTIALIFVAFAGIVGLLLWALWQFAAA